MSDPVRIAALLVAAALLIGTSVLLLATAARSRAGARLGGSGSAHAAPRRGVGAGWLGRWLAGAGLRDATATRRFAVTQILALVAGASAALVIARLDAFAQMQRAAAAVPAFGGGLAPVVLAAPVFVGLAIAAWPVLRVRAARRRRADAIEEDLPIALELLAALSEAGLGFDAALARLLDAQPVARPLAEELRGLQRDAAGGLRRTEALRRLALRIDRPVGRNVVAALIQAEEVGSGIAEVLRPLADDLRQQRRERALARAEALPDKLVVALVVGFLPGLMFWTLGPSFHQLVTLIGGITGP